jgi:putative ABC transport system substrate-binding protein
MRFRLAGDDMPFDQLRRREFLGVLGGAAAWPIAARAEQRSVQVIGLLNSQPSPAIAEFLPTFRETLAQAGFVEGRNLAIVYRLVEGEVGRLPALAAELVSLQVAAIVAIGGPSSVLAAKAATGTIPIVFTSNADPVETGMVASLNRPGGNVTGATGLGTVLAPKQLGLLRDMVPKLATIGLLLSTGYSRNPLIKSELQTAAQSVGVKLVDVEVGTELELDAAFAREKAIVDYREQLGAQAGWQSCLHFTARRRSASSNLAAWRMRATLLL